MPNTKDYKDANEYRYKSLIYSELTSIIERIKQIWDYFFYRYINKDTKYKYSLDMVVLHKVIDMVNKYKVHYKIFHDGTQISEYKEAASYCYWIAKLKPFTIYNVEYDGETLREERNGSYLKFASQRNEFFGIYLMLSAVMAQKKCSINNEFLEYFLYSLRYRDLTKEAIANIADCFYYHEFAPKRG